jgi:hypothetical protein
MKQKGSSLKKINKIDKPWQIWLKWGGKRPKSVKSEMQKGQ